MKKYSLIILVLTMLAICAVSFADTVQIGTGITTTSFLPIYGLYGYNYTQQIYTQAQINKAGNITKLRFFYVSGTITNSKDWVIYMGHTTKTAFSSTTDWEPLANLTQVFAGDVSSYVPLANNWMEIPLTTPFNYNNTDNLVIAVDENTSGYASMSWGAFTSGTNTGIYYYSDSVNPDPATPPTATSRTADINRIQLVFPNSSAPLAPTLLSPSNGGWAMIGDILSWTPTSGAGDATTYDVYFGTSTNPPLVSSNQAATTYTPTLIAGTTYYWKVVARNELGDSPASAIWSFKTPTATQLAESFENTSFPPGGWANPGTWSRSTSYAKHGTASAYKYGSSSSQYILSTPKVTITSTSTLNFWSLCSSTSGILQIVYSPDRTTWTQIGSDITYAATYTMYNTVVDLSSLAGNNYYLGVRTGGQSYTSYYVDLVIGPEITPEAPGAPTLSTPADLATNVNELTTFTWTAPTTGGAPTGYKLYCDTSNPPTTLKADLNALTYTLTTSLAYNTTYYWTVSAYNGTGEGPTATVRSFTTRANPTISTFPWVVDFGTLSTDWPVLNWSQLSGLLGGALTTGTQWFQDDFGNVTTPANKSAKINIYGTSRYGWLITPPIAIPGAGYELKFDLALTTYGGITSPTPGAQADDKFIVLISDSPLMTNPTVLREWNNTGSTYVYDNISPSGENHIISLNTYSGTKYLAFYGESSVSNGDNDLFVDNVTVRETPAAPIFSYSPTSIAFGTGFVNTPTAYQNVTVTNTGAGVINLTVADVNIIGADASMFSFDPANLPAALSTNQSVTIPVRYNPTAIGNHTATLRMVYNATNYDVTLSGNALGEHALYESFEGATFPPADWATATTPWEIYTTYAHTGTKAVKSGFSSGTWWLMTPTLAIEDGANTLTFWYRDYSESSGWDYPDEYTYVMLSTMGNAPENFTTTLWTGDYLTFTTTWQMASIDLSAYNGQNVVIAFKSIHTGGNYRIIDDVAGPNLYVPSGPPDPVTLVYPANGATGLPQTGFNLTWSQATTGGIPSYYTVYMSQDEDIFNSEYLWWETTNTYFNPVTEGGITFNYLDRWYWTVEAINDDGSAVVEPPYSFEIRQAPIAISTFPWTENFDASLNLPTDWTMVDVDGAGTYWQASTAYSHSSPNSFVHSFSTAVDDGQNGWLITPAIQVPQTGNFVLSWWNYNVYPSWMVYNGLLVNTTNDPNDPNWVELWAPTTVAAAWSNAVVNITPYAGQTVYFAFNYQGYNADNWYIDDVSIYELLVDEYPPVITHLPILNTPRTDINYLVYAEIADDPNWNNPIGGASVYYSTDLGTTWNGPIAMTPGTAPAYTAYIPAQPLGTTVQYYIQAWDSLNNMATTDTYSFAVNNPVWIWYDTGGTVYLGYSTTAFGPTVLYENPYYGTGIPMKLLGTDGASYYATTANLHIYSYDGTDIVDLITPIPVSFAAQTYQTIDLSSYDVNITTPYFMIAYEDIPAGNYFLFDETYDYGTTFVKMSGTLYTLSTSGSWCIGAYVTNGTSTIAAPVATIANVGGNPVISWNAVSGANAYNIWNASDPYSEQWTLLATTTGTTYTYTGSDSKKFFRVTATTDIPAKGVRNVNGLALGNNNQIGLTHSSIRPVKASKAKIEKLLRK